MGSRPKLLKVLDGEIAERPPIWFMRQAGRTLPEYHALRATVDGFIALCFDPEKAAEVTLQPMRRFAFDAAVIFADILLIPRALGQEVWFEAGEGPRLGALPELESLDAEVEASTDRLASIGGTVKLVRAALEPERAVIGFAGGPWTVATYMLRGRGGAGERDLARAQAFADRKGVLRLIDILSRATARYLAMQARAGAQVLKIFESWADQLPEDMFDVLVTQPHRRIVEDLRFQGVRAPVIGFPRGAGSLVEDYADQAGIQGVALDVQASAALGRRIQRKLAIQGALDPLLLRAGGSELDRRVDALIEQWGGGPYIFNLGHGVLPDTPIAHIAHVVDRVTGR